MEAAEARELIEDAIERTEAAGEREKAAEHAFRNRVSVLVGVFALLLAVVHTAAAGAARDSLLSAIEGSDTYAYMQAKTVRETVLIANANMPGLDRDVRASEMGEAMRLRGPDHNGHGIVQLQERGAELRKESRAAAIRSEGYEMAETALQLAIVLLSIALIAQSRPIVWGASSLAGAGILLAVLTALGVSLI
ncbi:MAG TPA: DUF4337 family protein [Novosphingobium sp.]|nr:DUF4337 family protein [Novosphingobium sp.]